MIDFRLIPNILGALATLLIISSCNKQKYKSTYYKTGELNEKIEINNQGEPDGVYEQYYKSGELRFKTKMKNNQVVDSVFYYHKNGKVMEKGVYKNNLKSGWWKYYDSLGKLTVEEEPVWIDNKRGYNQIIYYKKGAIDFTESDFFKIYSDDTLEIGKNKIEIELFLKNRNEGNYRKLYAILNKNISQTNKNDTINGRCNKFQFYIFLKKTGSIDIGGKIVEITARTSKKNTDSTINGIEVDRFFHKKVYVKDTVK